MAKKSPRKPQESQGLQDSNDAASDQELKVIRWEKNPPPSEQEAEARMFQEGYESFKWHDVPGAVYPKHSHPHDECIWILEGEMTFQIHSKDYELKAGDRLYLPANTIHTAIVPTHTAVTYLVASKRE